jgi:OmpA-OmpF porin, OOP family
LKELPSGFRGRDEIKIDEAVNGEAQRLADLEAKRKAEEDYQRRQKEAAARACQLALSETASLGTIQFDRASDRLSKSSGATITKLAKIANECPKTRVEISGHTDSEGIPERNQPLSERRATAVAAALIEAGVAADRLSAEGYGAERPIADNSSADGRAKNRRIEFSVVPE